MKITKNKQNKFNLLQEFGHVNYAMINCHDKMKFIIEVASVKQVF